MYFYSVCMSMFFPPNGFLVAKMWHKFIAHNRIEYSRGHKNYKASRRAVVSFYIIYKMNHII